MTNSHLFKQDEYGTILPPVSSRDPRSFSSTNVVATRWQDTPALLWCRRQPQAAIEQCTWPLILGYFQVHITTQ